MGFYNDTDHRQCEAVDDQGLDCAGPEGHEPPHANVNGEWHSDASGYVCDGCGYQAEVWVEDRPLCRREPEVVRLEAAAKESRR